MSTLKRAAIELIAKLPDDCTIEEIMYELNFVAQVFEGLKDANAGNVLSTVELVGGIKNWRTNLELEI